VSLIDQAGGDGRNDHPHHAGIAAVRPHQMQRMNDQRAALAQTSASLLMRGTISRPRGGATGEFSTKQFCMSMLRSAVLRGSNLKSVMPTSIARAAVLTTPTTATAVSRHAPCTRRALSA